MGWCHPFGRLCFETAVSVVITAFQTSRMKRVNRTRTHWTYAIKRSMLSHTTRHKTSTLTLSMLDSHCYPGRTLRHGSGRFHSIPEILWKQYSGDRIRYSVLFGPDRIRPKPVKTDSWIRSLDPDTGFIAFSSVFRPETASFLWVFAGNSRNTASGIIVLGAREAEWKRCSSEPKMR